MAKRKKNKKLTKTVYWICDKEKCNTGNTREIRKGSVLNDDVCDYCHGRIHEPVTIDLKYDDKP